MRILTYLTFILLISMTSCDPAIGVVISNKSKADKKVQVIYPSGFKFPGDQEYTFGIRDSIETFNLAVHDNYLNPITVPKLNWDTTKRTYSFILKANHSAHIEKRFLAMYPTWEQVFIIDNTDTIKLESKGKDFIKKPKVNFGGTWTHQINDKSN